MHVINYIFCGFAIASSIAQAKPIEPTNFGGNNNCTIILPIDKNENTVNWVGLCISGMAHGRGVMRTYHKGILDMTFFGDVKHGEIFHGVIDEKDGYKAGIFLKGKLIQEQNRNDIILAFRNASAAAQDFSYFYKRNGNNKSAQYYMNQSRDFLLQID